MIRTKMPARSWGPEAGGGTRGPNHNRPRPGKPAAPRPTRFTPPRFARRLQVELSDHDRETANLLRLASIRNARRGDPIAAAQFAELVAILFRRRRGEQCIALTAVEGGK